MLEYQKYDLLNNGDISLWGGVWRVGGGTKPTLWRLEYPDCQNPGKRPSPPPSPQTMKAVAIKAIE